MKTTKTYTARVLWNRAPGNYQYREAGPFHDRAIAEVALAGMFTKTAASWSGTVVVGRSVTCRRRLEPILRKLGLLGG